MSIRKHAPGRSFKSKLDKNSVFKLSATFNRKRLMWREDSYKTISLKIEKEIMSPHISKHILLITLGMPLNFSLIVSHIVFNPVPGNGCRQHWIWDGKGITQSQGIRGNFLAQALGYWCCLKADILCVSNKV